MFRDQDNPFAGALDTFNFIITVSSGFVKSFVVFSYELAEGIVNATLNKKGEPTKDKLTHF